MAELYILRHGETAWNREGRFQGALDSDLTALGRAQAGAMAALLAARGVTAATHALVASPQGRAQATARPIAAAMGAAIVTDPDLSEIDVGSWQGLTVADLAAQGVVRDPQVTPLDWCLRAPDGESFAALWERAGRAMGRLTGPSVVVTHGILSRFLRARALGLGPGGVADQPGGQGVIFRIDGGKMERLDP